MNELALIGVPSSAGARRTGQELGPSAFRKAGLLHSLREAGIDVVDMGDLPPVRFQPDVGHAEGMNLGLVAKVASLTADRVAQAVAEGRTPLVLGGDCSLSVGVVSGLLRSRSDLGLIYFDSDLDLNTPETSPSGAFDGMVMAHLLGRGARELAGLGPRRPLLSEDQVVVFGYDVSTGWIDPPELEWLARSQFEKYPMEAVRHDPLSAARNALQDLEDRADGFMIHFDVDVTNSPAVDVVHANGLDLDSALMALREFVSSEKCCALAVTELNGELDPDGSYARKLVDGLVGAISDADASRSPVSS